MKGRFKKRERAMRIVVHIMAIQLFACPAAVFGYEGEVHKRITLEAVKKIKSSLDESIKQIGCDNGIEHKIKGRAMKGEPKSIMEWIQYGSNWEDLVLSFCVDPLSKNGIKNCHFYNPVEDVGLWDYDENEEIGQSLIDRANDNEIGDYGMPNNEWSYQMAKDLYYAALTGDSTKYANWVMKDKIIYDWFFGKSNMNQEERDLFFAWTFQAIGHTLHLIQDASVPAHTRNDSHMHIPYTGGIFQDTEPFEDWTKENVTNEAMNYNGDGSDPWTYWKDHSNIIIPNVFIDTNPLPEPTYAPSEDLNQGLAEYSHANFLSKDSIADFDYPGRDGGLFYEDITENGKLKRYVYHESENIDNGGVKHLYLYGTIHYVVDPLLLSTDVYFKSAYTVDDERVHEDYAAKLIPRAVGYSAGLLDYFFRGKMDVTSLPIFFVVCSDTNLHFLRLKVKNMTESEETMSDGTYNLIFRYRDGDEEKTVQAVDVSSGELQYGDETEIDFELPFWPGADKISLEEYQSGVTCTLVFKGTLGNETDAVVGKVFMLGQEVKFGEAWDNGLAGNHPWTHSTAAQNPPNGETVNEVQDGILLKENKRYISYSTPRNNESFLYIPGSGVSITPNTYVEFKIDELSVQERPPDGTHWHVLMLYFNNGDLNIQFSYDWQFGDLGWTNVAYCSFTPGSITIGNIHQIFDYVGIEIPDPLYLTRIGFGQQLYELYEPSTAEHCQRTRVDFLRVIDAKEEQQE
ncbi:MAG: hypothetical protein JRG69_08660 [Deltaproteobacteria bacterium]|nr:hypothetical protein [Deltaproteobacteria bacterium]